MNNHIAISLSFFLYTLCTILLILRARQHPLLSKTPKNAILLIGVSGLAAQVLSIYIGIHDVSGINLGFYNALSIISAFITLFTLITALRYATETLLIAILPITMLTMIFDLNFSSSHILAPDSPDALLFHVVSSLVAYSILALAALLAILLSIQNRYLHNHQPGGVISRLPPLKVMECILFEALTFGFICLTVSLASGLLFLDNMFAQQLAHKTILSIIAWFVFLTLLIGRWALGWRGRIAIRWTLSGFFSLMLAYFGSKFVLEVLMG